MVETFQGVSGMHEQDHTEALLQMRQHYDTVNTKY